jgi:hypothetical protein
MKRYSRRFACSFIGMCLVWYGGYQVLDLLGAGRYLVWALGILLGAISIVYWTSVSDRQDGGKG